MKQKPPLKTGAKPDPHRAETRKTGTQKAGAPKAGGKEGQTEMRGGGRSGGAGVPDFNRSIRLDTWQFVRVMVSLEESGRRGALWRHWSGTWKGIDEELTALADTDFDAYSSLMLHHRLELPLPTQALRLELGANLRRVIKQMNDRMREKGMAPSQRQDLEYEVSGLKALLRGPDPVAEKPVQSPQPAEAAPQEGSQAGSTKEKNLKNAGAGRKSVPKRSRNKDGKSGTGLQRATGAGKGHAGGSAGGKQRIKRPR